jgi:hypothetical protein
MALYQTFEIAAQFIRCEFVFLVEVSAGFVLEGGCFRAVTFFRVAAWGFLSGGGSHEDYGVDGASTM